MNVMHVFHILVDGEVAAVNDPWTSSCIAFKLKAHTPVLSVWFSLYGKLWRPSKLQPFKVFLLIHFSFDCDHCQNNQLISPRVWSPISSGDD